MYIYIYHPFIPIVSPLYILIQDIRSCSAGIFGEAAAPLFNELSIILRDPLAEKQSF